MKSAKKLMLLLLSLVLLIGTFAVVALAENDADVATVVYPDGTTETYAVGESIVPKAFTDGFYEGKGNTLWQGDAWSFTVSGEASALADLKVTDAMKGKTIMASGAKQVYSKIDIHLPEGDYYEYITGSSYKIGSTEYKNAIYVLSGTSGTATHKVLKDGAEVEETVEYSTTKRVAGDYTVYFYDAASFAKFFSTSCSIELGGVVVDNKDLRTLSDTKITATLYADQTIGNTFYWGNGYDRATNANKSNSIAQGEGGNAKVYFDLNGHTVVNNATGSMTLTEMQLIMYSSKPGAHYYKEASGTAFYVSDGCSFFIGNNDSNTDTYSDNLSVHAKALFSTMYGAGAYVIGGHYYQTAGATAGFFAIARRVNAIQNASFYAQNGVAPLTDNPWDGCAFAKGTASIKNCSFYSFGTSPIGDFTKGATPKYENCSFYNITGVEGAQAATPKTVTFADGTSEQFFAETLEEAKAYVESLGKVKFPAPYGKWIDGEYMLSVAPVAEVTYDASFNATVAIKDTAFAKVYFTTEEAQADGTTTMVYHTTDDFASYFTSANLGDMGDGAHTGALSYSAICAKGAMTKITITIYADVKCDWFTFNNSAKAYTIRVNLDLNGYTLDLGNTSNQMNGLELWIYSSRPGAHFYSSSNVAFTVNDIFNLNLGAADANGTYARNINFHCKNLLGNTYGGGASIYGGNYYQLPGSSATGFVSIARRVTKINNANFFVLPGQSVFYDGAYSANFYAASTGANPITGCSFYALGEGASLLNSIAGATPKFDSCSFYGVAAENVGSSGSVTVPTDANVIDANLPAVRTVTWVDGTTEKFVAATLDEAKAFVETNAKAKAPAPYSVSKDGNLYLALAPKASVVYDDNFNATVVCEDGELTLVYYTVEETLTGKINYVTEPNIGAYLSAATHGGAKITLYQDLTSAPLTLAAEHVPVDATSKAQAESAAYYLDLNGHKLTFTGSGLALDVKLANLYVYSSVAGGVIDASNHTLFRSNNDDYKWINGSAHVNGYTGSLYGAEGYTSLPYIKPSNYTVWGEAQKEGDKVYADNLTVYCEKINENMYGNGAYINGGTFVQVDGVNPGYFLMMGRGNAATSHVQVVKNATFITNSTCAAAFNLRCSADRTFTNVTVISKNAAGAALTSFTELTKVSTFVDCNFVNVNPYLGTDKVVYNGASYGTTAATFSMADFDISDAEQFLAQGASEKTITVLGETYLLNGVIISDPATEALKLTLAQVGTQYYAIGATVPEKAPGAGADDPAYDYSAISAIDENRKVIAAGVASASLAYENQEDIAFTYQVDGGEVILVPSLGSPEFDGENFVSILNNLYNVKIVMYKDIVLKSGVQFATLKDATDPKNKVVKVLDKTGYVDWDLNGCTVTVAADATPIAMISERESQGAQTNNVLHYTNASFKLYSSVAGGQYINETAYPIFGINKYSTNSVIGSYLLGTNDPAVNGGDNLTVVSNGPISMAYETQANGPAGYTMYINGGTYVYNGTQAMLNVAGTVKVYNAKMLATGGALAMIVNQFWAGTNLDVQNLTAVSAASGTKLIESGNYYQIIANGKTHNVSIKDVAFAGGTLNLSYNNVAFTVAGEIKAPNAAGLALAYPEAPAGKSAAYTSISIYGVAAKLLAYYENPTTVTVNNTVSGLVETWLVGSTYVADTATQNLIQEEGVWYYIANPELVGKIDGVVVADICAPENAGKTVVVEVGGDREKLYFTVSLNGVLTYYYGDSAPAALPSKLAPADTQTYLITFYSDIVTDIAGTTTIGAKNIASTVKVDLNGYTWKHNSTAGYAFVITSATSFIYSSVPGGVLDVSNANGIACTDSSGHAYFGEATKDGSEYGKNLTVYCKSVHSGRWWSTNGYIVGGTYIQPEGVTASHFFGIDDGPTPVVRNSTFIVNKLSSGFVRGVKGTFTNCVFIAKEASNIVTSGKSNTGATFNGCYFYNVIPNIPEGTSVTYNDCFFSASSLIAQNGGVIAYTGEPVTKTVNGVDYVFGAKLVASATLVTWGYGLEAEYWVAGATATHADIILDGAFVYAFAPVTVGADPVTATASLKGFVSGMLLTQLEAQNQIIFKLLIAADSAIENIVIGGKTIPVSELDKVDGYYVLSDIYAPSKAADTIALTLIGAYNHEIELSLELYANAVLADESLAASHNLVYAMVEYVELMSGKNLAVDAPAGYETKLPEVVAASDNLGLYFSICHDETLTWGVAGAPDEAFAFEYLYSEVSYQCRLGAEGMKYFAVPHLVDLALGIKFYGYEQEFSYTLGNYIYALKNAEVVNAEAIAQLYALYNYAAYAADYVAE